jgi:hypothetical protein
LRSDPCIYALSRAKTPQKMMKIAASSESWASLLVLDFPALSRSCPSG